MGIPCYLGGMARGLLGRQSNLQMRQQRRQALQEADMVILAGKVDFLWNSFSLVEAFRKTFGQIPIKKIF